MSQKTRCAFAWLSAIFLASLATQSQAQTSAEFFKGKSIEFIVPAATGVALTPMPARLRPI